MFDGFLQAAVSGLHAPATSWRMIRNKLPSQKGIRGCKGVVAYVDGREHRVGRCQSENGHSYGHQFFAAKRGGV